MSNTPAVRSAWAPVTPTAAGVSFTMCEYTPFKVHGGGRETATLSWDVAALGWWDWPAFSGIPNTIRRLQKTGL